MGSGLIEEAVAVLIGVSAENACEAALGGLRPPGRDGEFWSGDRRSAAASCGSLPAGRSPIVVSWIIGSAGEGAGTHHKPCGCYWINRPNCAKLTSAKWCR